MKKKIKNRISHQEWIKLHPHNKPASSDSYFVKLANHFLDLIETEFKDSFTDKTKRTIALSVAAYFEDIISEFGLWQGFTRKHYQMYGKYLPFYESSNDYIPEEINLEDVLFLIWSIMQMEKRETEKMMLNPENMGIVALGLTIFKILDEEYETAPENEDLYHFFTESINYDDFIQFRPLPAWLYYHSYLIAPYTDGHFEKAMENLNKYKEHKEMFSYTIKYSLIFQNPCGPLALKTNEWLSAIVGEDTALGKMLLQIQFKYKAPNTYLVTDHNEHGITLLPFDSNEPVFLSKNTFNKDAPYKTGDVVYCNLIFYNGKWELNGLIMNVSPEQYEKDRKETEKHKANAEYSINLFLKANNNKPICYFKNGKKYEDFFNVAFNPAEKMKKNPLKGYENIVSFINPAEGITTIADLAEYIKDKTNPCYNKEIAEEYGLCVFTEFELFKGLIDYFVTKKLLSDLSMNSILGKIHGKKLVQENLDFMFRFFQPLSYNR